MEIPRQLPTAFPIATTSEESRCRNPITNHRRALGESSGNIQPSALDSLTPRGVTCEKVDLDRLLSCNRDRAQAVKLEHRRGRRAAAGHGHTPTVKKDLSRYHQYRARQTSDKVDAGEAKWPDELEEAFLEGHEIVGPIGREHRIVDGKQLGRFQLISEYIFRKTGVPRTRKQVSSHNQVLKQHVGTGRSFRKLLRPRNPTDDPNERDLDSPDRLERFLAGLLPRNPHPAYLRARGLDETERKPSPDPAMIAGRVAVPQPTIYPVAFSVMVLARNQAEPGDNRLHVYNHTNQPLRLPSLPLESLIHWRTMFPQVSSLNQSGAVDCEMTLLETSLNMNVPTGVELKGHSFVASFEVMASPAYAGHSWQSVTSINCRGGCILEEPAFLRPMDAGFADGSVKLKIHFAPQFWADTFAGLGVQHNGETVQQRAGRCLRGLSGVVELFATKNWFDRDDVEEAVPKRVAILLWRFDASNPGTSEGTTRWRTLVPPPSRILTNSPAPSPPTASSLEGTMALWNEERGSESPGHSIILREDLFGQSVLEELHISPPQISSSDPVGSIFYPSFEGNIQQENMQVPDPPQPPPPPPPPHSAPSSFVPEILNEVRSFSPLHSYGNSIEASYSSTTAPSTSASNEPYEAAHSSLWHAYPTTQFQGHQGHQQDLFGPTSTLMDEVNDVVVDRGGGGGGDHAEFGLVFELD